jgi:glycine dehydrogenase subunit 1
MSYIPNTAEEQQEMLKQIGVANFDELLKSIPEEVKLKTKLNLPLGSSEYEVTKELTDISKMNASSDNTISFLGGGSYDHFVPAVIASIITRSEFITAYTPYQAEVSQGTLQAIYEYQTMICRLTGMDVANASMYDGASAAAESCLLASTYKNRKQVIICAPFNPNYIEVIKTICHGTGVEIIINPHDNGTADLTKLKNTISDKTAAVLVQNPNYFGCFEDISEIKKIAEEKKALLIVSVDPISLGIINPPSEFGADIVVGEGQPLGIPVSFGGPYLGIFAVRQELLRKIPGRLSGMTIDKNGERGFVLTLQTREQQIRREKATSNICSNQGLMMLASTIYMALLGKQGIEETANLCIQKSHYLADRISQLKDYSIKFSKPFFKEFVVKTPKTPKDIISKLCEKHVFAGIDLSPVGEDGLLVAVTEKRSKEEMDIFVSLLREIR